MSENYTSILISKEVANFFVQIAVKNIVQYTIPLKMYGVILIFFNTNATSISEIQKLSAMTAEYDCLFRTGHAQESEVSKILSNEIDTTRYLQNCFRYSHRRYLLQEMAFMGSAFSA